MGKKKNPVCVNLLKPVSCAIACTVFLRCCKENIAIQWLWQQAKKTLGWVPGALPWVSVPVLQKDMGVCRLSVNLLTTRTGCTYGHIRPQLWGTPLFFRVSVGHCKVHLASLCGVVVPHNGESLEFFIRDMTLGSFEGWTWFPCP